MVDWDLNPPAWLQAYMFSTMQDANKLPNHLTTLSQCLQVSIVT